MAATGSSRDARQAGAIAAKTPVSVAILTAIGTIVMDGEISNNRGPKVLKAQTMTQPAPAPTNEPNKPNTAP